MIADSIMENDIVTPRVSVLMISYNHENFIAQAIESVIMQKTKFPFELVIGEDCSTDNTREIIEGYQQKYPKIIKLLPSDKRYGPNQNFVRVYKACRGEYIATLEGDDYWIDEEKLQMQVDLLDNKPELSGCFHHVKQLTMSDNMLTDFWPKEPRGDVDAFDFLTLNTFHTTALMFRKSIFCTELPEVMLKCKNFDYSLYLYLADKSSIGYIDRSMSVYRIHDSGVWSSLSDIDRCEESIKTYKLLDSAFNNKYHRQLLINIVKVYHLLAINHLKFGNKWKAFKFESKCILSRYRFVTISPNEHFKIIIGIIRQFIPTKFLPYILKLKKKKKIKLY
jgi:glycosyltransferase involved in cell wall biosynthesis